MQDSPAHQRVRRFMTGAGHGFGHESCPARMGYEMEHNVSYTIAASISDAWIDALADDTAPGITYWCSGMFVEENAWHVYDNAGGGVEIERHLVERAQIASALGIMAAGIYVSHDGTHAPLGSYHTDAARAILAADDIDSFEGDYDANTLDIMLQLATFGKVIYG